MEVNLEGNAPELEHVRTLSPFLNDLIERDSALAADALAGAAETLDRNQLHLRYRQFLDEDPVPELDAQLRQLRRREMIRIIYRDLSRTADLLETTAELSHLADFCVATALDHCYRQATGQYGTPVDPNGKPEQLIVLAMGKLGAFELNLSSDIDLIFLYTHTGEITLDDGRKLSHQEFFLRMSRRLIACLDDTGTIDQVFRVDMRLRPYGDSGPLVIHRAAMEKYYVEQGRDWERYAFIKARVIAGDIEKGQDFLGWMKPFVYRRHLDFSTIQSLREMKAMINQQVDIREMSDDLKLGAGGIREVEFIAQAHQLIYGGRFLELQQSALMPVLDELRDLEFIPEDDVAGLKAAYCFLRNSEHAIQAEYDRQTHQLPDNNESRHRLALAMGFDNWESFLVVLNRHRNTVTRCFAGIVAENVEGEAFQVEAQWIDAWTVPSISEVLQLRTDIAELDLTEEVLETLDKLMPRLLKLCESTENPSQSRIRMMPVVRAVLRRSTYLVFLVENHEALARAVQLVSLSNWISEQLEAYPILLYELTDRSIHDVSVSRQELEGKLREQMRTVEAGDLESQMDTLRQFRRATMLKIAAMELLDELSIMQTSDGLTALAEVILDSTIDIAWQHLEAKHGLPCDSHGEPLPERIAVIAYGKAGGLELAYGSDLDLVFICPDMITGNTDGARSINNNVFFVRLGQRMIHILTSFTRFGVLYEADLRLRPQGNKGPLVATMNAFSRYQQNEAWTWEHQALIRARFVAGDPSLAEKFAEVRRMIIQQQRDRTQLLTDVLDMREKMRTHLSSGSTTEDGMEVLGKFDLKHDTGAIVDIEFMVQYAVLGWGEAHQSLSRWTDVMRLLDELSGTGVFTESQAESLQRAYLAFRAAIHHEWLGLETDYERLQGYRQEVKEIWDDRMLASVVNPDEQDR